MYLCVLWFLRKGLSMRRKVIERNFYLIKMQKKICTYSIARLRFLNQKIPHRILFTNNDSGMYGYFINTLYRKL